MKRIDRVSIDVPEGGGRFVWMQEDGVMGGGIVLGGWERPDGLGAQLGFML